MNLSRWQNVTSVERVSRVLLGVGLGLLALVAPVAPVWIALGGILVVTGLSGVCPLYGLRHGPRTVAETAGSAASVAVTSSPVGADTAAPTAVEHVPVAADATGANPAPRTKSSGHRKAKRRLPRRQIAISNVARPGGVVHATDGNFDALVGESDVPVLVDFWAEWCGPCKAMTPTLDRLATELAGRARIVKVDVERCPRVAGEFRIRSVPTLAVFKDGEVVDVYVGAQSQEKLARALKKAA